MAKKKPSRMMTYHPGAGEETVTLELVKHTDPRFRASRSKARVPREAALTWQTDSKPFRTAMEMWPLPEKYRGFPHEVSTRQMQSYFRRPDTPRTVGDNVVYKGMHPDRLNRDELVATSTRPVVASSFANIHSGPQKGAGTVYRVSIPPGTPFLPIPPTDDQTDEHEILFPPGRLEATGPRTDVTYDNGVFKTGKHAGYMMTPQQPMVPARYIPRLSKRGRPNMNLKGSSSASSGRYSSTSAEISQQSSSAEKAPGSGASSSRKRTPPAPKSGAKGKAPAKPGPSKAAKKGSSFKLKF